jgi:hypothetical protein
MSHAQSSHIWLRLVALQAALLLGACVAVDPNRRPETPAERSRSVENAVADIVGARCELEGRCGHVGPGQKFDTRDQCASKMQGETAVSLNTSDCPLGVEPRKLDACITSILAQNCDNVFDALNRWNSCRNGQICYK